MKVAVHISGQQRYGENIGHFLRDMAVYDEVDLYLWHWDGPRDAGQLASMVEAKCPSNVRIAGIELQPQIDFKPHPDWKLLIWCGSSIFNLMSMTYAIRECDRMRTGDYDLVVRSRPDMRLHNFKPPTIGPKLVSVGLRPHYLPAGSLEIQDQFAIGTPEDMAVYAKLYDQLGSFHQQGGRFHPETYVHWWMAGQNGVRFDETGYRPEIENIHIRREDRSVY